MQWTSNVWGFCYAVRVSHKQLINYGALLRLRVFEAYVILVHRI